tara:strand:- start:396 stop:605 length:210 start_codon:yes stop_codon:yes gene_type:complete
MNKHTIIENELITKINKILNNFEDFEKAYINNNGDIIIRKKATNAKNKDLSILTNIFREIMKEDKKNRV